MKVIAIDIFEFNSWHRFNIKTISEDKIIDLSSENSSLIPKIGMFEEDHDVFFIELPKVLESFRKEDRLYYIPLEEIKSVIPLTEQARNILSQKLLEIEISNPIFFNIYEQISNERNYHFSKMGGDMVLSVFDIENSEVEKYRDEFLEVIKYIPKKVKKNIFTDIIYYERQRSFPKINSGFLYDVGAMIKSYYEGDEERKEKLEYLLALSDFCKKNEENKNVFSSFLDEYENNIGLRKLNDSIAFHKEDKVNNLLIIALYFMFRKLVRDKKIDVLKEEVELYLGKIKKETSIAIYWVGLFFGCNDFRDLYYEKNLNIKKVKKNVIEPSKMNVLQNIQIGMDKLFLQSIKDKLEEKRAPKTYKDFIDKKIRGDLFSSSDITIQDFISEIKGLKKTTSKFKKEDFIELVEGFIKFLIKSRQK